MDDNILLIDKPRGITSFKVCDRIKKKFQIKRIGHGGTLDPEATGLLVILLGKATRLFDNFQKDFKTYEGTIVLGESRDTQDEVGKVLEKTDPELVREKATPEKIEEVRKSFLGTQIQTAPIYSALKHKGKPLYHYARKNIEVEPKKREITVRKFEVDAATSPILSFQAEVSKGTYLRAIASDFGARLGTLGYLGSLRRTASGSFKIEDAHALDEVLDFTEEEFKKNIIVAGI